MPALRAIAAFALLLSGTASGAGPLPRTPAEYLQQMDADGDGRIALSEYQEYLSRGFLQMDRNGDGVLSASELPPGARARSAPTLDARLRALSATFDRQDTNNDGFLDARELAAPLR